MGEYSETIRRDGRKHTNSRDDDVSHVDTAPTHFNSELSKAHATYRNHRKLAVLNHPLDRLHSEITPLNRSLCGATSLDTTGCVWHGAARAIGITNRLVLCKSYRIGTQSLLGLCPARVVSPSISDRSALGRSFICCQHV